MEEDKKEARNSNLQNLVEQARQDLAPRLDIEAGQIDLVDVRQIVWRDGSLGCPQPGMMYTQALVPGLCIRLRFGEQIYHYHSGANRGPFPCSEPTECDQAESQAGGYGLKGSVQ